MIARIVLGSLLLLGLAGLGMVAVVALRPAHPAVASASTQRVAVVTAARALRPGVLIKPDDIASREMAQSAIPAGSFTDSPSERIDLVGSMVRRPVAAGAALLSADVLRPGDHGFLAAVLRPGKYAVTVAVDAVSGSAGLIWPGDTVDLILTQVIEAPNLPPGRRVAAETVLQNVRVIAIDQQLAGGPQPGTTQTQANRTVTLEVSAAEAEKVQVAARIGRLSLLVRATEPGPGQAAPRGPTWAGDVSPALDANLQPPNPSVVRVFMGTESGKEFRF
jgi:pilus assembly protein CpaB